MTIACCYVVPEGIVLGSDSTITTEVDNALHYLNHNQKIFEVGADSTFGIVTWGLTSFGNVSYRSLIALLGDRFRTAAPQSVLDAANIWSSIAWSAYRACFAEKIDRYQQLETSIRNRAEPVPETEKKADDAERDELNKIYNEIRCGFCLAGYVVRDRMPHAYEIELTPNLRSQPFPSEINKVKHFGRDSIVSRIIGAFDGDIKRAILASNYWKGDSDDLDNLLATVKLERPDMTIRDAIDYVHFTIYSTVKATKFSTRDKDCGGPIELAVITTDRNFRWVRHKGWDSAISDWNP